ncbi:MAG: sensor histidine kinase [Crocinitomicaceae bacterium]
MNKQMTYYRNLSWVGFTIFLLAIIIQIIWLRHALTLDRAEHQLVLEQMVPDIALEVNGISHDAFHGESSSIDNIKIDSVANIVSRYAQKQGIEGGIAFSIFSEKNGINELIQTNTPELTDELMNSGARVCLSCIVSISMSTASAQKEGESDEEYYARILESEVFQYYSPVKNVDRSDKKETIYFSIYHEKSSWKSIGSLWYLFVGGIFLNGVLLLLFRYLLQSLAKYKRLTQVKDDFFNNMTHEFKTPLSSIRLASRILKSNPATENNQSYFNLIEKESLYLENQIDRLLEFSLLDSRELEVTRVPLTFPELFEKVRKRMTPMIDEKKAVFSSSIQVSNNVIQGDQIHLTNCFCNLIENSLKYGNEGILIHIQVEERGGKRCISVKDNGPGIERTHHLKIFDRFYRAQQGNQYKNKGFGIGLSYVKTVVELHGGNIELNTTLKTGTEFLIYL